MRAGEKYGEVSGQHGQKINHAEKAGRVFDRLSHTTQPRNIFKREQAGEKLFECYKQLAMLGGDVSDAFEDDHDDADDDSDDEHYVECTSGFGIRFENDRIKMLTPTAFRFAEA